MKNRKFIKLINNEKLGRKVMSAKACDSTSYDNCTQKDYAHCTVYAYDSCKKDYAACYEGADDICYNLDDHACGGAGARDITN